MTKDKRLKPEYAEALLLYATTTERLKSIADRLGLRYINLSNYMRRNYPVVIEQHKALLLSKDNECFAKGVALLQSSNLSPHQVKEQLGYGNRFINYIRANHPELMRECVFRNATKKHSSKVVKYAEAVELLREMKNKQYNVIKKVAKEVGLNYHSFRLHVYTYHRELIGLDPAKNKADSNPHHITRYSEAVALLASEPKQPENLILYVSEKLGLSYHALRSYIYIHHPELTQRKRK